MRDSRKCKCCKVIPFFLACLAYVFTSDAWSVLNGCRRRQLSLDELAERAEQAVLENDQTNTNIGIGSGNGNGIGMDADKTDPQNAEDDLDSLLVRLNRLRDEFKTNEMEIDALAGQLSGLGSSLL